MHMLRFSLPRLANDNHSVMAFNLSTLFDRVADATGHDAGVAALVE
jgi:hypothetical protein